MSEMSEKAIKLINDLRRDISIDIMFTPEKNAEDDSLKQLVDYIAELEGENAGLKEELQQEKTRSQLNLEAEERRMLNITYYCAEIDRLNARIAELEAAQRWHVVKECNDVATPIDVALRKRIAELEGKIDQLTAHDATERQDDKSPNDTQTQTIVYGKESEE